MRQATVWVGLIGMFLVGACAKPVQKEAACCPAKAVDSQVVDAAKSDSEQHDNETVATLKAIEMELSLDLDGKRAEYEEARRLKPQEVQVIESRERKILEAEEQLKKVKARRIVAENEQKAEASGHACNSKAQVAFTERSSEMESTIATLKAIETELSLDTDGKRAQFEAVQDKNPEDMPVTPELQILLNGDPIISQLDQRVQQTDESLRAMKDRYEPNHRLVIEAQAQLVMASERAAKERAQKAVKYNTVLIEQTRREYLEALEQLTKVKERRILAETERRNHDAEQYRRENQSKG